MTRRPPFRKPEAAPPGRVRIVAGKWRGRFLPVAEVEELRPTSERVRETLFNWLAPLIEGAHCLDLFAGTGVLGLEALSRGAAEAVLVERSREAADVLRQSVAKLGATSAIVIVDDACRFLRTADPAPMNIVFMDPPFAGAPALEAIALLAQRRWLAPGGCVYIEQDARSPAPDLPDGWTVRREKKAGNVRYLLADTEGAALIRESPGAGT
jgi:16S rRNA (guanine966-N2)-methyltransferase